MDAPRPALPIRHVLHIFEAKIKVGGPRGLPACQLALVAYLLTAGRDLYSMWIHYQPNRGPHQLAVPCLPVANDSVDTTRRGIVFAPTIGTLL